MEEIDEASIRESVDHQVPDIVGSMWKFVVFGTCKYFRFLEVMQKHLAYT